MQGGIGFWADGYWHYGMWHDSFWFERYLRASPRDHVVPGSSPSFKVGRADRTETVGPRQPSFKVKP